MSAIRSVPQDRVSVRDEQAVARSVRQLEQEGLTTSDAQSVAEASYKEKTMSRGSFGYKLIKIDGTVFSVPARLAPLLKAAPALLAVCKMLFDEDGDPKRGEVLDISIFSHAIRAIAHAEGRHA